jgi:lysozyme family protein
MDVSPLVWDQIVGMVLKTEGGLSLDPQDAGNWTGGEVGQGELKGSNFGISAASYPNVDIANLTHDQAVAIYYNDFFLHLWCDKMPGWLALLVFDAAVNNGSGRSARWLQEVAGVDEDGQIGAITIAAVRRSIATNGVATFATRLLAKRLAFMSLLEAWPHEVNGWSQRLIGLAFVCQTITEPTGAS